MNEKKKFFNKEEIIKKSKLKMDWKIGKSMSVDNLNSSNKRTVQVKLKSQMPMTVFKMFENALRLLKIDNVNDSKQILKELIKIEEIIKEKIELLNENIRNKSMNLEFYKKLTSSKESLFSEISEYGKIKSYGEFLKVICCPFCSKLQANKIKLIEHLDECFYKNTKEKHLPYSKFQILPNNMFKCHICKNIILSDLRSYFEHLLSGSHILAESKATEIKSYTDFLFCSCCKILIANTGTQIYFHMSHDVHKSKTENENSHSRLLKKGIDCVYAKNKKFKCLHCPFKSFKTSGEILTHLEKQQHDRKFEKNAPEFSLVFCEPCFEEVHVFTILSHLTSIEHKNKENNVASDNYELCFFCGFVGDDLSILSRHMKSGCDIINSTRLSLKTKNGIENLKENDTNNESISDGGYVLVKDYKEIPTLFSYFEQFGEIASLEKYDDRNVIIKFKEKSTTACILLLKDRLSINGVKLEITADEKLFKSGEKMSTLNEKEILKESENSDSSCDINENEEEKDGIENIDSNFSEVLKHDRSHIFFQRVTSHLVDISQNLDSSAEIKTITDCLKTCTGEAYNLVGFAGCGLLLPLEGIDLYCEVKINSPTVLPIGNISVNDSDLNAVIFLKKLKEKLCDLALWQNVIFSATSFPCITCQHVESKKSCTIICAKSAMLLTEMLCDCLKESDEMISFCLLIRIWLNFHKLAIRKFDYVIISLLIFFFTSQKIVKLSREKYYSEKDSLLEKKIQDEFDLNKDLSSEGNKEAFNLQELFHKFLLFLSKFDFNGLAIYLPLSYPVPKTFVLKKLKAIDNLTEYSKTPESSMYITMSNYLQNIAFCVSEKHVKSLLKIINDSIKIYEI